MKKSDFFSLLLECGAFVDSSDSRGFTPLHLAAKGGCEAAAIVLLDFGADPNARGQRAYSKTPLHRQAKTRIVQKKKCRTFINNVRVNGQNI